MQNMSPEARAAYEKLTAAEQVLADQVTAKGPAAIKEALIDLMGFEDFQRMVTGLADLSYLDGLTIAKLTWLAARDEQDPNAPPTVSADTVAVPLAFSVIAVRMLAEGLGTDVETVTKQVMAKVTA